MDLPLGVLAHIFSYFDIQDAKAYRLVCIQWYLGSKYNVQHYEYFRKMVQSLDMVFYNAHRYVPVFTPQICESFSGGDITRIRNKSDYFWICLLDRIPKERYKFVIPYIVKPSVPVLKHILLLNPEYAQYVPDIDYNTFSKIVFIYPKLLLQIKKPTYDHFVITLDAIFSDNDKLELLSNTIYDPYWDPLPYAHSDISAAVLEYAFKKHPKYIRQLKNPTYEQKLDAVRRSPLVIQMLKDTDHQLWYEAVKHNGLLLSLTPKCHITDELITAAVSQTREAIRYVSVITDELLLLALKSPN